MRLALLLVFALSACSTVASRRDQAPDFTLSGGASLQQFQGCFAERTAKQQVVYLPRASGGSFSSGAGPQRYVAWLVDVDDLGASRRVSIHAVNSMIARQVAVDVRACL